MLTDTSRGIHLLLLNVKTHLFICLSVNTKRNQTGANLLCIDLRDNNLFEESGTSLISVYSTWAQRVVSRAIRLVQTD